MNIFHFAVLLCVVPVLCGCRSPSDVGADSQELDSVVVVLKGNARFRTNAGPWNEVKPGMRLKAGYEIQTANDAYLDLWTRFDKQWTLHDMVHPSTRARSDAIRIFDNSVVQIDRVRGRTGRFGQTKVEDVRLTLKNGSVFCSTRNSIPNPRYEVDFANAIVRVSVGQFYVTANGLVTVSSGAAVVETPGVLRSQEVLAGQSFNFVTQVLSPLLPLM